jgi:ElaB/YqjD/DUF883 family membrane-anchored ribosome-binding protein
MPNKFNDKAIPAETLGETKHRSGETMGKDPRNLSEAIHRLESASKGTGNGHSKLSEDFETVRKSFEALKEDFFKATGESLEQGREKVKEYSQTVDKQVHENPWWALGIVGLFAFLIGFLLGRKD